ncbi:MAG: peptidoglycan DD-metalloendopeptidase family protein [bacterium]
MNKYKKFLLFLLLVAILFFSLRQKSQAATFKTQILVKYDTYVANGIGMTNSSQERNLFAGYDNSTIKKVTRIYMKIDSEEIQIPSEDINSAYLNLYQYSYLGTEPFNIAIMAPQYAWEIDQINWINQVTTVIYQHYYGISVESGWKQFDITNLVKRWIKEDSFDKGLMFKMSPDTGPAAFYWSYDCVLAPNLPKCLNNEQPYIEISYEANTSPISGTNLFPANDSVFTTKEISFSIQGSTDQENDEISYTLEISDDNFQSEPISAGPQVSNEFIYTFEEYGKYDWRIKVADSNALSSYSEIYNISIVEEIPPAEEPNEEILGIFTNKCIVKYFKDDSSFDMANCKSNVPMISNVSTTQTTSHSYLTQITGKVDPKRLITVFFYRCKETTILDPRTFFMCIYEKYKEIEMESLVKNQLSPLINLKYSTEEKEIDRQGNFSITISTSSNPMGKKVSVQNTMIISDTVSSNRFTYILKSSPSNQIKISSVSYLSSLLSNFFKRIIGVTQWYGKTKFLDFHTGIDFGAKKEKIFSPEDGTVVHVGWDNYFGSCLSGGNILKIKHSNGIYSVYYHLGSYASGLKVGSNVSKGQYIATSGNTGSFNCQPLAFHLHFETRKSNDYTSHTNPVPLVNIDWTKVKTLGSKQYPDRLLGENPHPTY